MVAGRQVVISKFPRSAPLWGPTSEDFFFLEAGNVLRGIYSSGCKARCVQPSGLYPDNIIFFPHLFCFLVPYITRQTEGGIEGNEITKVPIRGALPKAIGSGMTFSFVGLCFTCSTACLSYGMQCRSSQCWPLHYYQKVCSRSLVDKEEGPLPFPPNP